MTVVTSFPGHSISSDLISLPDTLSRYLTVTVALSTDGWEGYSADVERYRRIVLV